MLQTTEILIDWLQIYGHCCDFSSPLFQYKLKQYGTKHFAFITECYYLGDKIAEIAHKPRSGILHQDSVLIKFENSVLYSANLEYIINLLISSLKFKYIHVTRVDLCIDFMKFLNNLDPEKFINKFLQNKLLKIGRGNFKVVGIQQKKNTYEYLRFGSNLSSVSAYLYNKSKELNQVKNKPYIRENWTWYNTKFDSWKSTDTWRLEFSIKEHSLIFVNPGTGEIINIELSTILNKHTRQFIFDSLLNHYFYFVHNNGKTHKDRMRKVATFNVMDDPGQIIIPNDGEESGRMQKIFIRMFEEFNNENRQKSRELAELGSTVLESYIQKYDLKGWKNLKTLVPK